MNDIQEGNMIWFAVYMIIGCTIALISLISTKPEKLSLWAFVLAHALWPASLGIVILVAIISPHRDEQSQK
jgi:hypothetical protein